MFLVIIYNLSIRRKCGRKKVDLFLNELEIETENSENKTRNYRNIPAHGQNRMCKTRFKFMYITDIYRTFLNRIILKLLGFHSYYNLTSCKMININEKKTLKKTLKKIHSLKF